MIYLTFIAFAACCGGGVSAQITVTGARIANQGENGGTLPLEETGGLQPATTIPPADDVVLAATSPWRVDYAENECRLFRTFGTGDRQIDMRLVQISTDAYDLAIAGHDLRRLNDRVQFTLTLDPQRSEVVLQGYAMQVPQRPIQFLRTYDLRGAVVRRFEPSQLITISSRSTSISLRLNNTVAAIAALQTCYDNLLSSWGVDIAHINTLSRRAQPSSNAARWVTSNDYPREDLQRGGVGTVAVLMTIGVDGRATMCRVIGASGSPTLDAAACTALSARARFRPALDAQGQPAVDFYTRRVRWNLPGI